MKRRFTILGILLLGTLFLAATGLLEPQKAFACEPDAAATGSCVQNGTTVDGAGGAGGGGTCTISNCTTTFTGPTGVECCCWYQCPSGGTWVCKSGYCPS